MYMHFFTTNIILEYKEVTKHGAKKQKSFFASFIYCEYCKSICNFGYCLQVCKNLSLASPLVQKNWPAVSTKLVVKITFLYS